MNCHPERAKRSRRIRFPCIFAHIPYFTVGAAIRRPGIFRMKNAMPQA